MLLFRFLPVVVTAGLALAGASLAETSRDLAERHPAGQVVVEFLRLSINREFAKVAALVEPGSLGELKSDYLKSVTNPNLPLDEAQSMCRAVGAKDEIDIRGMSPVEFYVAYNNGMQKRYNVTDAINRRIADTLELNLLSVAEERPDLVHLLVRTKHQTLTHFVENLEVLSLTRKDGKWMVVLGGQQPKYTPLAELKQQSPATPASGAANK